ncbi:hypothetical protein DZG01_17990 [Pseudomonas fluorescens]|nr:hypothetical protein DZG01_17990 [Pseudomonas fluorescens]
MRCDERPAFYAKIRRRRRLDAPLLWSRLWEQSLLAKQTPRFLKDRIASIAGKPCSHNRLATK